MLPKNTGEIVRTKDTRETRKVDNPLNPHAESRRTRKFTPTPEAKAVDQQ